MKHTRAIILSTALFLGAIGTSWSTIPPSILHSSYLPAEAPSLDSLKLKDSEVPEGFKLVKADHVKSIQAATLYDDPSTYAILIGDVTEKGMQSLEGPDGANGSILYFIFKDAFKGKSFVEPLIWGEDGPTDEHPEQILVKDNVMVIVSFDKGSDVAKTMTELMIKKLGL
jgi:hypothetical protein